MKLDNFINFLDKQEDWLKLRYELARRSLLSWRQEGGFPAETYWQTESGQKELSFRKTTGFDPEKCSIDLNMTLKEIQEAAAEEAKEKTGRKNLLALSHVAITLGMNHLKHNMTDKGELEIKIDLSVINSLPALKQEIEQVIDRYWLIKNHKKLIGNHWNVKFSGINPRPKQYDYDKLFQVADLKKKGLSFQQIGDIVFNHKYDDSRKSSANRAHKKYLKLLNSNWVQDINFP